jgi:hypothetical protein
LYQHLLLRLLIHTYKNYWRMELAAGYRKSPRNIYKGEAENVTTSFSSSPSIQYRLHDTKKIHGYVQASWYKIPLMHTHFMMQ